MLLRDVKKKMMNVLFTGQRFSAVGIRALCGKWNSQPLDPGEKNKINVFWDYDDNLIET